MTLNMSRVFQTTTWGLLLTAIIAGGATVASQELKIGPDIEPGAAYVLERQVGHLLRRAHQRHSAIFQEHIGTSQLTPLQFAALIKLRDLGEVSQNQLGRLIAMDAATMQGVIKRLAARGLIQRRPDPNDRRRLILSLGPKGIALADGALAAAAEITRLTLDPLSPDQQRDFLALLERIAE